MSDQIITLSPLDADFCALLDTSLDEAVLRAGGAAKPGEQPTRWSVTTSYGETFRAIVLDGEQPSLPVPDDLAAAARRITGLDEVALFRAQANAMLPGQGLGRHTDIPEFLGARRWAFPDWLLVAMLHSGLYDDQQIRVASAVVWPTTTNGGVLRIFDRPNLALLAEHEPVAGSAVICDSTRLPHEVAGIPGEAVEAGPGDEIRRSGAGWEMRRADGAVHRLAADQVRVSFVVKLGCFADEAARQRHFARDEEPLDQDAVIATLTQQLPVAPESGPALHQQLVDHFVSYM
jgi:hypothetical protein